MAQGYQKVTPSFLEDGIGNVFSNLGDVVVLTNDLLQGKVRDAGIDTSRILFNTTFGVLGFFDVATRMGLHKNDEDFGQTLGKWGLGPGPYLVLPFYGASSLRDAAGLSLDLKASLPGIVQDGSYRWGLTTLELQSRIELLENHAAFTAMGFVKTAETAHPGYDRPTTFTFRKALA